MHVAIVCVAPLLVKLSDEFVSNRDLGLMALQRLMVQAEFFFNLMVDSSNKSMTLQLKFNHRFIILSLIIFDMW